MSEEEMIENLSSVVEDSQPVAENTNNQQNEVSVSSEAAMPTHMRTEDAINVHDYVCSLLDKLVNADLINDNIHHIDEEIDVMDSLIFNDKLNHKCVVIDITNLWCPVQNYIDDVLGNAVQMNCCQSGIIIQYDKGRMYITKNNLFIIKEIDGKVSSIDTYYRAKNDMIKFNIQTAPEHSCNGDIEMIKFAIKSRCVRVYKSIKDENDINNIYQKLIEHYKRVVDINNLIKIEYLRFDIGC